MRCHKPGKTHPADNRFYCRLGQFFGDLCAAEQHIMDGLIKREVYQRVTYVDYQALCTDRSLGPGGAAYKNRGVGFCRTANVVFSIII